MKPRRVKTAPGFDKALRELPPTLRDQTIEAVKRFIDRAGERSLRPERKQGLRDLGIPRHQRSAGILCSEEGAGGAYSELFHVGPHDDYRTIGRKRP